MKRAALPLHRARREAFGWMMDIQEREKCGSHPELHERIGFIHPVLMNMICQQRFGFRGELIRVLWSKVCHLAKLVFGQYVKNITIMTKYFTFDENN